MSEYSVAPEYLKTYQRAIADINRARQDNPTFDDVVKVCVIPTQLLMMSSMCAYFQLCLIRNENKSWRYLPLHIQYFQILSNNFSCPY